MTTTITITAEPAFRYLKAEPVPLLKSRVVDVSTLEVAPVCTGSGDIIVGSETKNFCKTLCECVSCESTLDEARNYFFSTLPAGVERGVCEIPGEEEVDGFDGGFCWLRFFSRGVWKDILKRNPPKFVSIKVLALLSNVYRLSDDVLTCSRIGEMFHVRKFVEADGRGHTPVEWLTSYVEHGLFFSGLGEKTMVFGAYPTLEPSEYYAGIDEDEADQGMIAELEFMASREEDYFTDRVHARETALNIYRNALFKRDVELARVLILQEVDFDVRQQTVLLAAMRRLYNVGEEDVDDEALRVIVVTNLEHERQARVPVQIHPDIEYGDNKWIDELDDDVPDTASHSSRDPEVELTEVDEVDPSLQVGYCYLNCFSDLKHDMLKQKFPGIVTRDQLLKMFSLCGVDGLYTGWISISGQNGTYHIERVYKSVPGAVHVKTFWAELDGRYGVERSAKYDDVRFGMPYTGWTNAAELTSGPVWYNRTDFIATLRQVSEVNFSVQTERDRARTLLNALAEHNIVGVERRFPERNMFVLSYDAGFSEHWSKIYAALDYKETAGMMERREPGRQGGDGQQERPFSGIQDASRAFRTAVEALRKLPVSNPDIFLTRADFEQKFEVTWVMPGQISALLLSLPYLRALPGGDLIVGNTSTRAASNLFPGLANCVLLNNRDVLNTVDMTGQTMMYIWSVDRLANTGRLRISFSLRTGEPVRYEFVGTAV